MVMNYSKLSNKELLNIVDPSINKGAIPLKAIVEKNKRKLKIKRIKL